MTTAALPLVFVYLDFVPRDGGSGADLRCYSNARAFLDLGYEVELVVIGGAEAPDTLPGDLARARLTQLALQPDDPGLLGRAAFRLSLGTSGAFRYAFKGHRQLRREVTRRAALHPDAIHFIEGERNASILPFIRARKSIWSHHDSLAAVTACTVRIACELQGRKESAAERRAARFARRAEHLMLRAAPLVLTISDADRQRVADGGLATVELLPMSVPDERATRLERGQWGADGRLTLLHVGRTAHLPSYRSLEFLLGTLWRALPERSRAKLRLLVAGPHTAEDLPSRRIRALAAPFPEVRFLGFVDDLDPVMASADLQVIGSVAPTGLRTRIIESFARGLPVLSTSVGAEGVVGLRPGYNVLIADRVEEFTRALETLLACPSRLTDIAEQGRLLYQQRYSRSVVAATLGEQLRRHGFAARRVRPLAGRA